MLGFDLTNQSLYDELYPIVANKRIIDINKQWAGSAGTLVANSSEYFEAATAHGAGGKVLVSTVQYTVNLLLPPLLL